MSDNDGVLLEVLQDQHKLTIELLQTVLENQQRDHELGVQIPQISEDIKVLKAVQREQGKDIQTMKADQRVLGKDVKKLQADMGEVKQDVHHVSDYLVEQGMPARA